MTGLRFGRAFDNKPETEEVKAMRKLMALLLAMALLMTSAPMALAEAVLPEKAASRFLIYPTKSLPLTT